MGDPGCDPGGGGGCPAGSGGVLAGDNLWITDVIL